MDVEDFCSAAFQILTDRDVADEYEALSSSWQIVGSSFFPVKAYGRSG